MITLAKLDIKQTDGSTLRVHFALRCDDLERLVRLALTTETQAATTRDAALAVTVMQTEVLAAGNGLGGTNLDS